MSRATQTNELVKHHDGQYQTMSQRKKCTWDTLILLANFGHFGHFIFHLFEDFPFQTSTVPFSKFQFDHT